MEIVLPRVLAAQGIAEDDTSVVVVPPGGRHVNHFWRLLHEIDIPHVTLLDLDLARRRVGEGSLRGETAGIRPRCHHHGHVFPIGKPLGSDFYEWRSLVRGTPDLPVGQWIRATAPELTDQEVAAYDAPFPDRRFQAGARAFPELAMVEPKMEGVSESLADLQFWSELWARPSFIAIGMQDLKERRNRCEPRSAAAQNPWLCLT